MPKFDDEATAMRYAMWLLDVAFILLVPGGVLVVMSRWGGELLSYVGLFLVGGSLIPATLSVRYAMPFIWGER